LALIETGRTVTAVRLAGFVSELANVTQRTNLTSRTISEGAFSARIARRLALERLVQTRNTEQTIGQTGVIAELTRLAQSASGVVLGLGVATQSTIPA
jgi:hypothetical protein